MENQQTLEAERLLKWIRDNRRDWDAICNRGDPTDITDYDMYRLLKEMIDQSFYQIAIVLLTACDVRPKSTKAVFSAFVDTLLEQENGMKHYMQKVVQGFE